MRSKNIICLVTIFLPYVVFSISCSTYPDSLSCSYLANCLWNSLEKKCHSVLPCALETNQTNCNENTWICTWQSLKCVKANKRATVSNVCHTLLTQNACKDEKRCNWQENSCKRKPTIILSVADDLAWYDMQWNNPRSKTPVLSGLRANGIDLQRYYTARFCAPSRAMILTGRYAWKLGLQTDLNFQGSHCSRCASGRETHLIPHFLREYGGYSTRAYGKWHLGAFHDGVAPVGRGFDSYVGYLGGTQIENSMKPNQFIQKGCSCAGIGRKSCNIYSAKLYCVTVAQMINSTKFGEMIPISNVAIYPEETTDLFLARVIRDDILGTKEDSPLFLYTAFSAPHYPEHSGDNFEKSVLNSMPVYGTDAPLNGKGGSCGKQNRIDHLAMVHQLDETHRMVIDALEYVNRFDDTIFVFISDNGGNGIIRTLKGGVGTCRAGFNYPLRGGKYSWWEGGIRVIGFVSSVQHIPNSKKGSVSNMLISAVDWKKTLVTASGITSFSFPENENDGIDFWDHFTSSSSSPKRTELPLQNWLETNRQVILFTYQNATWKIMKGYPFRGSGAGNLGSTIINYSGSNIEQPHELPRSELTYRLDKGVGSMFMCTFNCLFNVQNDPQEFDDRKAKDPEVLQYGINLLNKYKSQGIALKNSGFCDPGFYATDSMWTTDSQAITYARSCGGFVSWIEADGTTFKPLFTSCDR